MKKSPMMTYVGAVHHENHAKKKKCFFFFFRRFWVKEPRRSENIFAKKRYTLIPLSLR